MDSRAGSSILVGEWRKISRVSAWENAAASETLSKPIPSCLWPFKLYFYYEEWKRLCCSSLCLDLWLVLCRRCLNYYMICMLLQIIFCVLYHIAEVQTCWHCCQQATMNEQATYYLYLPICTAYVNHFVASVCLLHLLFLEGFEYHRQSMILLSPLLRNLYHICVLRIVGALTMILVVRHFLLEHHLMSFHWRKHIVVCLKENCVSTHRF